MAPRTATPKAKQKRKPRQNPAAAESDAAASIVTAAAEKAADIVAVATAKAAALVAEAAAKAANVVDASGPTLRTQVAAEAAHAAIEELTKGPVLQEIVNKAVDMGLERLGFRTQDKEAMQDNMRHLNDWVDTMRIIRTRGIGAITVAVVTLLLTSIGYGLLHFVSFKDVVTGTSAN